MIALIATFDSERLSFLPVFVEHYRRSGVADFRISLQVAPGMPAEQRARTVGEAEKLSESAGVALADVLVADYDAWVLRRHHDGIQASLPESIAWIVWADSDELQEYPAHLETLTEAMAARQHRVVGGRFVDRLHRDGDLADYDSKRSPWAQYPLGSDVSERMLRAGARKITLAARDLRLALGNHMLVRGHAARGSSRLIPIHHFKWQGGVLERLARRLAPEWKARCAWWTESEAALACIERTGGRIPLERLHLHDFADDRPGMGEGPFSGNPNYTGGPYWPVVEAA